jgi:hypothetical protein
VTVTSSRSLTRSSSLRQGSGFTVPYLVAEKKDGAWKVVERF